MPAGWLRTAADTLTANGYKGRVELDTAPAPAARTNLFGYVSWGSNDPALGRRRLGVTFAPGALAMLFVWRGLLQRERHEPRAAT